jgi:hypothetical protein
VQTKLIEEPGKKSGHGGRMGEETDIGERKGKE